MPTCQGEEQWIKRKWKCQQKTLFNDAPKSLQIQPVRRDGVLETRSGGSTTPPYDPCNSSPAGGEGATGIRRKSGGGRCPRQISPGGKENPVPQREELLEGESLRSHPASPMARDLSQRNQSQRQRDGTSLGVLRAEVENLAAIKGEYQLCRRVGHPKVETGVAPANLAHQSGAASASPACLSLAQEPHLPQGPSGPFIFTAVTTAPRGHIGYRDP
jgi:hypothetical protein